MDKSEWNTKSTLLKVKRSYYWNCLLNVYKKMLGERETILSVQPLFQKRSSNTGQYNFIKFEIFRFHFVSFKWKPILRKKQRIKKLKNSKNWIPVEERNSLPIYNSLPFFGKSFSRHETSQKNNNIWFFFMQIFQ